MTRLARLLLLTFVPVTLVTGRAAGQGFIAELDRPGPLWSVLEHPSGDLVVSADSYVARLDGGGTPLWSRIFSAHLLDHGIAADGGTFVCGQVSGSNPRAVVGKLDAQGQELWGRRFEPGGWVFARGGFVALEPTSDGGVVTGGWWEHDSCSSIFVLYKLDGNGNFEWAKTSSASGGVTDILELSNGSLVTIDTYSRMFCFSATGSLLWITDLNQGTRHWLALAADGDLLVTSGWTSSTYNDAWVGGVHSLDAGAAFNVARLAPDGSLLWSRHYLSGGNEVATGIVGTPDNGCVVVGETRALGSGEADLRVMKLDASGNPEWQNLYGDSELEVVFDVNLAANGDLLLAGGRGPQSANLGAARGLVLRLDAQGNAAGCAGVRALVSPTPGGGTTTLLASGDLDDLLVPHVFSPSPGAPTIPRDWSPLDSRSGQLAAGRRHEGTKARRPERGHGQKWGHGLRRARSPEKMDSRAEGSRPHLPSLSLSLLLCSALLWPSLVLRAFVPSWWTAPPRPNASPSAGRPLPHPPALPGVLPFHNSMGRPSRMT
jgi:hypothetical protein